MIKDWKAPILATVGLASLAIAIPVGLANAQVPPPGQGGQRGQAGGEFQRPPGQPGNPDMQMMQRGMMGGGGQATMVTDNQFLFILQGNMLYKVNKNNLEVIGQGMLPMPQPMGRGGAGGGAPGTRGGGGGGDSAPTVK
jgi:hypothetical protein